MRKTILMLILQIIALGCRADGKEEAPARTLDDIRAVLDTAVNHQVQEKVYVHTDNECYFIGDTIWYKAYVVRADNLHITDMSRILYVELLNADGMLVERQNVVVSSEGYGTGNFCIRDSLYSGYYELRAYTRWMLNFNVYHHRYSRDDRHSFYSNQMASDYYRQWDGLYSRVFPIYNAPKTKGDYSVRNISGRPRERIYAGEKTTLHAAFFPEGGHLIVGVPCRVAFELTTQDGAAVDASGVVKAENTKVADFRSVYMGRGEFTVTPGEKRMEAEITVNGEKYSFRLPEAETAGVAMMVDGSAVRLTSRNLPADRQYGMSVLCRGALQQFAEVKFDASGKAELTLDSLPTGVNDITVFDTRGNILADRLIFVNNHDYGSNTISVVGGMKKKYAPYEQITLDMHCEGITTPSIFSLAIRDMKAEDPTYNNGNIMTDLLLSSELKGFVANPAYYFEKDDKEHTTALDLLMMVQGWRKYKWQELADTAYNRRRYKPEHTMSVEGGVYKTLSITAVDPVEMDSWRTGVGMVNKSKADDEDNASLIDQLAEEEAAENADFIEMGTTDTSDDTSTDEVIEYGDITSVNSHLGVNHGPLKREVLLEAELTVGTQSAGAVQLTHDGGRYMVEIPPFYGSGYLKMRAYNQADSAKKNMLSRVDKGALDETEYADYYVKRDLFYPVFTSKYNYYQNHTPVYVPADDGDETLSRLSMENGNHLLSTVNVEGKRRRGRRAIDYSKPAYVATAYDIYNEVTDRGLSFGYYDMRQFPVQVCKYLFGNMGRYISFNVNGRYNGYTYYRNYAPDSNDPSLTLTNRNVQAFYENLMLRRLQYVRVYTDYEPRNEDVKMESSRQLADATVEFVSFADDAVQPTFRDRHIVVDGIYLPDEFYSPDYSRQIPQHPTDYRRTLYWNPNARTDAEGNFTATFYNNSRETSIKISAAGLTANGKMITAGSD